MSPALIATLLLASCATAPFNSSPGSVASSQGREVRFVCPELKEYPREFQARAADELDSLPSDSAVAGLVGDYAMTRDQIRVCQEHAQ